MSEKPKKYIKTAESGKRGFQAFCGTCGTPIYSSDDVESPAIFALREGCIKQRNALQPKAQMWSQSTQQCLETLSNLPKFEKQLG